MTHRVERALLSVSDKTGLENFARGLSALGIEILSTGGTFRLLAGANVAVREVSEHTGWPEMMGGRIKTLHPKVHGGILQRRDEAGDREAAEEHGIAGIDLVVVNLYPFEETVGREGVTRAEAIEEIDIGGPAMLRSAAKNHRFVAAVTDPADYGRVLDGLERGAGALSDALRRELAAKAFALTARYDAAIARWLAEDDRVAGVAPARWPAGAALAGRKLIELRYGENPHQMAALYATGQAGEAGLATAEVLSGKELSYNNLVDLDAALALAKEFDEPFACVIKHNNPCGAAAAGELAEALEEAWSGDPLSAFGSVLAFTRPLDLASADFLVSGGRFVEAIVAPAFEEDALGRLTTRPKWGRSVRLLACGAFAPAARDARDVEFKKIAGGFLVQERDLSAEGPEGFEIVTRAKPDDTALAELAFAVKVAKHTKSNAIVLAKGRTAVGVGAGQMSRVDAVHLAVRKAGERARGSVLASDAFFPFADGVEAALEAGVRAVVQPGGSRRDAEVIAACDARGVPMAFTGVRHFRH